ncbi:DNA cytosine methyltransferase [Rhizobium leguminosarum]|uniref:DNA cytosine methyltransferase n=1 Tax=Rhizobium leguminosarum TaxID=384 RepID=UPI0004899EA0|nr:DNA cytosine methyltransferase [Rhizobium leguminosarum]
MDTPRPAPLGSAGENIRKFKKKQVEYFLKIADEVSGLREALGVDGKTAIASWLREDMGFSDEEADLFERCPSDVLARKRLLEKSDISVSTLHAIINSNAETRSECFIRIARADLVDEAAIEAIRDAKELQARSPEEIERQHRSEAFEKASLNFGSAAIARLEREAMNLLSLLEPAAGFDDVAAGKEIEPEERDHRIRQRAADLLGLVEDLFGSDHPPRHRIASQTAGSFYLLWPTKSTLPENASHVRERSVADTSITYAWYALKDLADGVIAVEHSSGGREGGWKGPHKCLEFLAGKRFSAISHASAWGSAPTLKESLTFVDVDAGFGGTALGLQAAGFRASGVWIRDAVARSAMRKNRPSWRVRKRVDADLEAELHQLRDAKVVDVVTSGLPWHHYPDKKWVVESRAKAVEKTVSAVRILRPRAFVFEAASELFDGELAKPFEDLGYDVQWHVVDVASFGIAQAKSRSVIVGARDGCLDGLSMPLVEPPVRKTLAEAIGELVAGPDLDAGAQDPAHRLSQNVLAWMKLCTDDFPLAPELPRPYGIKRRKEWKLRGIDISEYADPTPTPYGLGSKAGFRLTSEMLARIQGFPKEWFVPDTRLSCPQIADAFPPIAAKMVGLAILSALTGAKFDQKLAAESSMLSYRRINVWKGDPAEWLTRPPSWLLSDPRLAFRKSAGRQNIALRKARYDAERASSSAAAGDPSSKSTET